MTEPSRIQRAVSGAVVLLGAAALVAGCVPDPGVVPPTSTTTTSAAPTTSTTTEPTTTTSTTTSTTTEPTTTTTTSTTTEPTTTTTTSTTTTSTTTTTTTEPPTTTTTSTTTTTAPATSVTKYTPLTTSCQGSALGQTSTSDNNTGITTQAPSFVANGANFAMRITPDPMTIPVSAGGQTLQNLNQLTIKFPVPANSTYVSATLSGGSNIGSGTPTVTQSGGVVTLSVPGNLAAGTTAVLPTVTLNLKANGTSGSQIRLILAGSSYSNPGITFNAKINLFSLNVATKCFVNPSPVFATTPIS